MKTKYTNMAIAALVGMVNAGGSGVPDGHSCLLDMNGKITAGGSADGNCAFDGEMQAALSASAWSGKAAGAATGEGDAECGASGMGSGSGVAAIPL